MQIVAGNFRAKVSMTRALFLLSLVYYAKQRILDKRA